MTKQLRYQVKKRLKTIGYKYSATVLSLLFKIILLQSRQCCLYYEHAATVRNIPPQEGGTPANIVVLNNVLFYITFKYGNVLFYIHMEWVI